MLVVAPAVAGPPAGPVGHVLHVSARDVGHAPGLVPRLPAPLPRRLRGRRTPAFRRQGRAQNYGRCTHFNPPPYEGGLNVFRGW